MPLVTVPVAVMLALRFLKLLAVAGLFAGTLGAFMPASLEDRQRAGYAVAGPAFGATWFLGLMTSFAGGVSLFAPWILASAALSMFSINVVLWSIGKEGRRSTGAAALALSTLAGCVALMVWKPA